MKKIYLLFCLLFSLGLTAARAQDSSGCNGTFLVSIYGSQADFLAIDSMPGVVHRWSFGDSTRLTTTNSQVIHTYSHSGAFVVSQVVTDSAMRCRDSSAQTVYINLNTGPSCTVSISFGSDSAHRVYTFVANTAVSAGTIDTIAWTINDTLAGYGDTLTRTLANGAYTVCVSFRTTAGCQAQSCLTVDVQDSTPSNPPPPPDTCTIAFTAVPDTHRSNEYTFSVVDGQKYDSVVWTIINDQDSSRSGPYYGRSFTYSFRDKGTYWVSVAATLISGCNVYSGQNIYIDSLPPTPGGFITSYPNPATTQVTLDVIMAKAATLNIRIYNSMGTQVLAVTRSGYAGSNQVTLPIANLPIGVYYIQLQYGDTVLRSKIQKL